MGASEAAERRQYLSFTLAGTDYAVGILRVKEILQYETITRVPSMPPSVRGVVNLRGTVVPMIDLAVKFGLPETPITRRSCILVVEAAPGGVASVMGIIADSVSEVLELGSSDVAPPPLFGTRVRADHLLGMGKVGEGFVLLLDLDKAISADEGDLVARIGDPPLEGGEGPAPRSAPEAIAP